MLVWCIYDIESSKRGDKTRRKIVKAAEFYGLYRVQKSVFLGTINDNELDEFRLQCEQLIDESADSVYIFPLCKKDFRSVITMGQAFDSKLVTDKVRALFV